MYQYIRGKKQSAPAGFAVVDAGGVGYLLAVSEKTAGELARIPDGDEVKLYTHLHVREDALELFGFLHSAERASFLLLTAVSGVGPKAALSILSIFSPDALLQTVLTEDARSLAAANGVGLKTAQKIIFELKDKLGKDAFSGADFAPAGVPLPGSALEEAINALTVLGYPRPQALRAAQGLDAEGRGVEEIVRALLQVLGGKS